MDFGAETSSRGGTSSSLHNFSFLPSWGTRIQFRCVKPSELTRYSFSPNRRSSDDADDDGSDDGVDSDDGGIEAVREKLMIDFRAEVDKLQSEFVNHGNNPAATVTVAETAAEAAARPWNLRTRRAVCKGPNNNGSNNNVVHQKPNFSPVKCSGTVNLPARNGRGEGKRDEKGKKRAKFSNSLSKSEIESDILALTGVRPAKRPKKRSKLIQNKLDKMLPGFLLTEITADMYKVNEQLPASRKKY